MRDQDRRTLAVDSEIIDTDRLRRLFGEEATEYESANANRRPHGSDARCYSFLILGSRQDGKALTAMCAALPSNWRVALEPEAPNLALYARQLRKAAR